MADYYTFGVVPADVGRYVPRFAYDTTSAPTLTQAQDIIDDHAADLCAFLYGMGVAVQALNNNPTLAMYRTAQRYIILRLSAQVLRLRNQNSQTMADRLDEEADAVMKRLREIPQDMGSTRPVSVTSANIMHSNADYPGDIYRASITSGSRLAINAAVDKM
jgi:hypothetical protein